MKIEPEERRMKNEAEERRIKAEVEKMKIETDKVIELARISSQKRPAQVCLENAVSRPRLN